MSKKNRDDWWIGGLVLVGLGVLYYMQTGMGKERDSALLSNTLEGKIDMLIAALNERFGKRWVDYGVDVLNHYVQTTLPMSVVGLVGVVANVENISKRNAITSYQKQQLAVQMASRRS